MRMDAPYTASQIADYLLWRTRQERPADPDYLTPMKLQKLLYYVQGWSLAETGAAIFREQIEAWCEGPVVPAVQAAYQGHEKDPILDAPESPPQLDPATRELIENVWDKYKHYSAFGLSAMAQSESPWQHARNGKSESAPGKDTMAVDDIQREFEQKMTLARERFVRNAEAIRAAARENTRRSAPWLATPAPERTAD